MAGLSHFEKPRWLRDFARYVPLKSQFVFSGNVRDLQVSETSTGTYSAVSLSDCVHRELRAAGYAGTIVYDLVNGFGQFGLNPDEITASRQLLERLGLTVSESGQSPAGPTALMDILGRFVSLDGPPVALLVDFASRLLVRSDTLSEGEHRLFANALVQAHRAKARPAGPNRAPAFNTIVWIAEREGNLPDWFLIDNPRIRSIPIPKPDNSARNVLVPSLLRTMPQGATLDSQIAETLGREFVEQTEGLLLLDLTAIAVLARRENIPVTKVKDAVRNYKVGVTEDPWAKIPQEKIRDGEEFITARVKGQDHAVVHVLDIIKRAITGVGGGRRGGRPRGVAFLAGPTGVGKTELAKTITQLLFNDESAYIRFDMSEFSAEHADQRLIGAPPGYVGYDAGGELTNAIREKPFSVVLFDEIEKAHPRILDKFLQVLDDGLLTSGRGERVYFSEALILFTSNLGIYRQGTDGERVSNVLPSEEFSAVQSKVRSEIDRHFKQVINRPELLNRMGENIIVFDFIRDPVALEIFEAMVASTIKDLADKDIFIEIFQEALATLRALCLKDLSNGGRGIRNQIEAHLINPLARALFDAGIKSGSRANISAVVPGKVTRIELRSVA
ncbi:AAA family ATPase [Hyphomicrobium sp. 99]|uniref:AAA family ATPase n=1 Tax=Hyphomicrobium sp. 99 TaxID=1163419 RepID=UPI0005F7BD8C|nr:AAA family ATPase [Hyphomicrobium sp. 99]